MIEIRSPWLLMMCFVGGAGFSLFGGPTGGFGFCLMGALLLTVDLLRPRIYRYLDRRAARRPE